MAEKPLTWQQVLAVLAGLGVVISIFLVGALGVDPSMHRAGWKALAASAVIVAVMLWWHHRATHRQNLQPDVLATLATGEIYQAGAAHLTVSGWQEGPWLLLEILAQNLCDGPARLKLSLAPEAPAKSFRLVVPGSGVAETVPPLWCEIPGAAVVSARIATALAPIGKASYLRIYLSGSCRAKGRKVRFNRRTAIINRSTSDALMAMTLFLGHAHIGSKGTCLQVPLQPWAADLVPDESRPQWTTEVEWEPGASDSFRSDSGEVTKRRS